MDYRHTEDFARRMEQAAMQAHAARAQAADEFWNAVGRALRAAWNRFTGACRRAGFLPEA